MHFIFTICTNKYSPKNNNNNNDNKQTSTNYRRPQTRVPTERHNSLSVTFARARTHTHTHTHKTKVCQSKNTETTARTTQNVATGTLTYGEHNDYSRQVCSAKHSKFTADRKTNTVCMLTALRRLMPFVSNTKRPVSPSVVRTPYDLIRTSYLTNQF